MITLLATFDTNDFEKVIEMMHGIKSRVAFRLNDENYLSERSIKWHYFRGKKGKQQEIDISDVKKNEGTSEECVAWSDVTMTIHTINVLRDHPHVKDVLIHDDSSEGTSLFIDYSKPIHAYNFREIIENIS